MTRTTLIRWRRNEPIDEHGSPIWSRVHRVALDRDDLTLCRRLIPTHPYMEERDEWITGDDVLRCLQCERRWNYYPRNSVLISGGTE